MADMTYAVHTATCTYLLDDEGVCRWALTPGGRAAPDAERSVGAQFVACLDLRIEGGLSGELRVGAAALFVHRENGRLVLLRTAPIEHVEYRGAAGGEPADEPSVDEATPIFADPPAHAAPSPVPDEHTAPLPDHGPPTRPFPMFTLPGDIADDLEPEAEALDLEDLLSVSVTEVTVSLPLYRPPDVPPASPPGNPGRRRSVIGPGRRLR
jgi:hypothetical protein